MGYYRYKWEQMYPGMDYPTPEKYPHMFPEGAITDVDVIEIDPFSDFFFGNKCSDPRICKRGLIDYKCQLDNECYLNIIELALVMIGFLMGTIIMIVVAAKILRFLHSIFTSLFFIHRFV